MEASSMAAFVRCKPIRCFGVKAVEGCTASCGLSPPLVSKDRQVELCFYELYDLLDGSLCHTVRLWAVGCRAVMSPPQEITCGCELSCSVCVDVLDGVLGADEFLETLDGVVRVVARCGPNVKVETSSVISY